MLDCSALEALLQRAAAGVELGASELDQGLAHHSTCERCAGRFEVDQALQCGEVADELPSYARYLRDHDDDTDRWRELADHVAGCERCTEILADLASEPERSSMTPSDRVEPAELFVQALVAGLTDPDVLVRVRAAKRLGELATLGPDALRSLAEASAYDPDEQVRSAAAGAIGELDAAEPLPQRLIGAWPTVAGEAARDLVAPLLRLAGLARGPMPGVSELSASGVRGAGPLIVTGSEGISGRIETRDDELWLVLHGLPHDLEGAAPVIAVPDALAPDAPRLRWSGERPGLVPVPTPVSSGSLKVLLGVAEEESVAPLFTEFYVLNRSAEPWTI